MFRVCMIIPAAFLFTACDLFKVMEERGPTPHKIERVIHCNRFKTCLVVFSNGKNGLMTSPKQGEYGCKSMSDYSFNRCDGP